MLKLKYEIVGKPAYSALKAILEPGESIIAEAGAMLAIEGDIIVETRTAGGVFKGLLRKFAVGETLFVNTFKSGSRGGIVWLAPSVPGDISYLELKGNGLIIQDYSYLAHHGNVDYELKWRGLKGLLAEPGAGLVWMRVHGYGGVWINSYGTLETRELAPGERMVIDNGHIVAMEDTIDFTVGKFGGWKSFLFGGEGLAVSVVGPGKIYLQTRTLPVFAELLRRFIPKR